MKNYFRNGCIALTCSMTAMAANAEGGGIAAAAGAALDAAKSDVDMTAPKVMMVVASVVGCVILLGLIRKA